MESDVFCRNMKVIPNRVVTLGISEPQEARANTTWFLVQSRAKTLRNRGFIGPVTLLFSGLLSSDSMLFLVFLFRYWAYGSCLVNKTFTAYEKKHFFLAYGLYVFSYLAACVYFSYDGVMYRCNSLSAFCYEVMWILEELVEILVI